jgi:hypothetical protein
MTYTADSHSFESFILAESVPDIMERTERSKRKKDEGA